MNRSGRELEYGRCRDGNQGRRKFQKNTEGTECERG